MSNYNSPMERILNLPDGSTELPYTKIATREDDEVLEGELIDDVNEHQNDTDEIDTKILQEEAVQQYDDIYNASLEIFNTQIELINNCDPKYASRLSEVANQFLNTALSASKLKYEVHKNNMQSKKKVQNINNTVTNNNLITADRNEILKMLKDKNKK